MKAINTGSVYRLYDDSVRTFDKLPTQTYNIVFNPQAGFSLVQTSDIVVTEKVYGIHTAKVDKVINSFKRSPRNLGVILSGDKGIGKSLFAKMIAQKGIECGYPVIIVDTYIPGIAAYLNELDQEAIILFDEYDKTFCGGKDEDGNRLDPSTEMLTLFDGLSLGKKLFIITCNNLRNLNDYLINRPGRFHYHFRFDYPDAAAIKEYLTDKHIADGEINKVIQFAHKINLNYDCLRAIAFELQTGDHFEDIIKDLNIINMDNKNYDVVFYFIDGTHYSTKWGLDMFSNDDTEIDFDEDGYGYQTIFTVTFSPVDAQYNSLRGQYEVYPADIQYEFIYDNSNVGPDYIIHTGKFNNTYAEWQKKELDHISIHLPPDRNIHYAV